MILQDLRLNVYQMFAHNCYTLTWNGIHNPFYSSNVTYFQMKQDILGQRWENYKNVVFGLIYFIGMGQN